MNDLIPINTNEEGKRTVYARDLHRFLEVKTLFKDWIVRRIQEYDFVEGIDFCSFLSKSTGGRPSKEYDISIDMAKELSMVEHNEKGKQARQYFIECERKTKDPILVLNDPVALRRVLLTYSEKVILLEKTVNEQAPKVIAFNRIATADGSLCITSAAKHLQVRPKDLFQHLTGHEWIYRRTGNKGYLAYQKRIQQGLMEHKITTISKSDGSERIYEQARITPKGLTKLSESDFLATA